MRWRWLWGTAVLCALCVATTCAAAAAKPWLPPGRHIFAGLTGGTSIIPFERMVGKHPPVFETYMTWDTPTSWLARPDNGFRARLALHISTASGYGQAGVVSPQGIASGRSDSFLVNLGRNLARSQRVVYVRLMGEMNGYWNAYSAFSADGISRGPQNSPRAFRQAWRRSVLILRGGSVSRINRKLRELHLPPLRKRTGNLPRPKVAFLWVPQDAGSPDIAANSPRAYWPGGAYVDWVGTDFYASYPNFNLLNRFYAEFPRKPFVFSEYALYGGDDPRFVRTLFAWVKHHHRVRMLNYYQGFVRSSRANLAHYPASRAALKRALRPRRFLAYPPEYAHAPGHHGKPPIEVPPLPPIEGVPPGPLPPITQPPAPSPPPPPLCVPMLGICVPNL